MRHTLLKWSPKASFALLCYASSWVKCHHPAAFYTALLNSQPTGFYSTSQIIQDARRHHIEVFPIDINCSRYDSVLELDTRSFQGIRLGFREIKGLKSELGGAIEECRGDVPFASLKDLVRRAALTDADLECLASADALRVLSGNRHQARWKASEIKPYSALLDDAEDADDDLLTPEPTMEKDLMDDYASVGLTLRAHPMALLRDEYPFNKCKRQSELIDLRSGQFVRVAGLVTCMQRPGTAKGTMFLTLEDETGNMNVIVWARTQETFRKALLTSKLMLIKGTVEINRDNPAQPVIHIVAGQLHNLSDRLDELIFKSREFH